MRNISFRYIIFTLMIFILLPCILSGCQKSVDVPLYFAKYEDNRAFLVPEITRISISGDFYKDIITELIKGPDSAELYPTLPPDVKVLSVELEDKTAEVDLSREVITNFTDIPHSSTTEPLAIYSIVNTLTEFEEIDSVKITIEGRSSGEIDGLHIEDFWGHVGIEGLFYRNEDIVG